MKLSGEEQHFFGPVAQPGHHNGGALEHLTFTSNNKMFERNEVVASSKANSESLVRPVMVLKKLGGTHAEI